MPDLTLCKDDKCPFKRQCYRFMAEPDKLWQSYFDEAYDVKTNNCSQFIQMNESSAIPKAQHV